MHAIPIAPSTAPVAPERHRAVQAELRVLEAVDTAPSAAAEVNRWLFFLTVPFVLSAAFFMALISTGQLWLIGGALMTGPGLLIMAFIYLALSSDTNGDGR